MNQTKLQYPLLVLNFIMTLLQWISHVNKASRHKVSRLAICTFTHRILWWTRSAWGTSSRWQDSQSSWRTLLSSCQCCEPTVDISRRWSSTALDPFLRAIKMEDKKCHHIFRKRRISFQFYSQRQSGIPINIRRQYYTSSIMHAGSSGARSVRQVAARFMSRTCYAPICRFRVSFCLASYSDNFCNLCTNNFQTKVSRIAQELLIYANDSDCVPILAEKLIHNV